MDVPPQEAPKENQLESTYSESAEQLRKALKEMLSAIEGGDNIAALCEM